MLRFRWQFVLILCVIGQLLVPLAAAEPPNRRIVGYFAEWRNGSNGLPTYMVEDIPWEHITHINYAFAQVNETTNRIDFIDRVAAVETEFPGNSDAYPYAGHFNQLSSHKQRYPHVKTLIAVGGWAASRGFYTMCETAAGREAFADSAVQFLRDYDFDGLDIDYEYPTSTAQAGNPNDQDVAEPRRGRLYADYLELVKLLRERLDQAGREDGREYLLTMAAPASSWILGGMMMGEYAEYMDFVNMMTYDFHGAWNGFVGHNSALLPDDRDPETRPLGVPVLNVDWAYRYFRGIIPPSKITMGVPYYTRGWRNVNKGSLPGGLYGSAAQSNGGAVGIDNIWHDKDENGVEIPAGANPLWHVMNLAENRQNLSYAADWGFDPDLGGTYERFFDDVSKVPYVWNENKRVFLSLEDEESLRHRIDYVVEKGLGGIMMWEFAGDYERKPNGEYGMGATLTTLAANLLRGVPPADPRMSTFPLPAETADYEITFGGNYDHPNYTFALNLTNHGTETIAGGWKLAFSLPKTTTLTSVWGATFTRVGEHDDFQRYEVTGSGWQNIEPGASITLQGMMKLTFSGGPRLFVLNGKASSFEVEPGNRAPTADAGPDASYRVPAEVRLDGGGSSDPEGERLTYQWTQVSGPSVALRNADQAVAGFDTPAITAETRLVFELTVADSEHRVSDQVTITLLPPVANRAPNADAGRDQRGTAPAEITLMGAGSDPDNDPITFSWIQEDGPRVTLTGADTATPRFSVDALSDTTTYIFSLTVSDGELSDRDSVVVILDPRGVNQAPEARVTGPDTVKSGDRVRFDAGGSSDPDGDPISFSWDVPREIDAPVTDDAVLGFSAPVVASETTFELTLRVSDGQLSDSQVVMLRVQPSDDCPDDYDPNDYPAWDAAATYQGGDMVSYMEKVYRAKWWSQGNEPGASDVWEAMSRSAEWNNQKAYNGGDEVDHNGRRWRAKWWTRGEEPGRASVWEDVGPAGGC
ncbi:glycosyl hydrolase family 18 protein [Acanthopleuribacter pedis]|uniref:Chitinase C-terminal domain-containing protein n=1 Tax=Acanthopleuribacter pedis TaxID=442870 RepID=A0A8J7U1M4_9BACT|nr:glycosyl hydrolase family 18 protein [Acanthopleuribacter pedis]MBO1316829.1 chitinase C-terminal domain-containing protein [Acanthopleuribacter pedis]